jgi:hypothetical protein
MPWAQIHKKSISYKTTNLAECSLSVASEKSPVSKTGFEPIKLVVRHGVDTGAHVARWTLNPI